jgi:hypothetical protein
VSHAQIVTLFPAQSLTRISQHIVSTDTQVHTQPLLREVPAVSVLIIASAAIPVAQATVMILNAPKALLVSSVLSTALHASKVALCATPTTSTTAVNVVSSVSWTAILPALPVRLVAEHAAPL